MKIGPARRIAVLCVAALIAGAAAAADLPAATKRQLAVLKLDPAILDGLEEELRMPSAWLAAAPGEPPVQLQGTWTNEEWRRLSEAFRARFPMARVEFIRAQRDSRQQQMVLAYKQGRILSDIATALGVAFADLKALGALADLRELPNFARVAPGMGDPEGLWVAQRHTFWCMAYNKDQVRAADLPRDWGDLLTNPVWRKGQLGFSNSSAGWLPTISTVKGVGWARNFIATLFREVKPQRRNEGRDASVQLVAAGELGAVIPASDARTKQLADKGAPVGFHCPDIVPSVPSQMGLMRGTASPNSARIFLDWFLSREGQIAMAAETGEMPVHRDLQRRELVAYPDIVFDKDRRITVDPLDASRMAELQALWLKGWTDELR